MLKVLMRDRKYILQYPAAWQSMLSFFLAFLITGALLYQLVRPWHKISSSEISYVALDVSVLPAVESKVREADIKPSVNKTEASGKIEKQARPQILPGTQQSVQTTTLPVPEVLRPDAGTDLITEGTEEKSTAPPGLRIDKAAIARAYADSRSDIKKLVGRTGKPLETIEHSPNQKFGREVSRAKIEDCIKPNPEGITIGQATFTGYFAAAALAYNAVTGKCK